MALHTGVHTYVQTTKFILKGFGHWKSKQYFGGYKGENMKHQLLALSWCCTYTLIIKYNKSIIYTSYVVRRYPCIIGL